MRLIALTYLLAVGTLLTAQTIDRVSFFGNPLPQTTDTAKLLSHRNMPWIERYEARTETRDLDAGSQEFTLRLLPNTPGKRRAQQAYYDALAARPDYREEKLTCAVTTARYEDWLRLYAAEQERALTNRLLAINTDRQKILNREIAAQDVDLDRVFTLRTRATDYQLRLAQLDALKTAVLRTYGLRADSLNFAGFLLPTSLVTNRPKPGTFVATERTRDTEYDLSLLEKELALEETERRQYIDFIQFQYRGPQAQLFREKFSIGLGFQLQDRGADKIKQRELELDQYELNQRLRVERENQEKQVAAFTQYTEAWESAYATKLAIYQEEEQGLARLAASASSKVPANLNLLLDIAERRVRNEVNLLKTRIDLVEEYLDFLKDTEQLCTKPEGGWLYNP